MSEKEEVLVEVKRAEEKWSVWEVQDQAPIIIKGKSILTKAIRTSQYNKIGEPIYRLEGQNVFSVIAPKELKGPPSEEIPPPDNILRDPSLFKELPFKVIEEPWSIYELEDGTIIKTRLIGVAFLKTNYYDRNGDPFFVIQSAPIARIIVAPSLKKRIS